MWLHLLILINILTAHSHPLVEHFGIPRDLMGLFEDDISSSSQYAANTMQTAFSSGTASHVFGETVTSEAKPPKATPTTALLGTSHSIIGILPTDTIGAAQSRTATLSSTAASASASAEAPPPPAGATPEAARMSPGEAAEWKVIGLVVICIGFVATAILSIVFFDSWWGFLGDLMCRKRRREGVEDLVPDWEKRSWEFKLASEDGHRYPTLASLECIAKERTEGGQVQPANSLSRPCPELMSPRPTYLADCDPHPLEPLFRRPSTKPITSPQVRT